MIRYRLILTLALSLLFCNLYAYENWDVVAKNGFKKAETVYVSIEFSEDASIFDLDTDEFLESSNEYVDRRDDGKYVLKRFTNRFVKKLKSSNIDGLKCELLSSEMTPDYELKIILDELTESGGLEGKAYLIQTSTNKAKEFNISLSDGRWNSPSKLLIESAEKLAMMMANKLAYNKGVNVKAYDW